MTDIDGPPTVPLTVLERLEYLRSRHSQYWGGLVTDTRDNPAELNRLAWSLAESDLLAILGRKGERAFRFQMHAEKVRA